MEDNKNKNEGFKYTYSAREQEEIRKIREKYDNRGEGSKIERLRRLDAAPAARAQAASLVFGVVGTLALGFGMSLIMSNLGELIGTHKDMLLPLGIAIGAVGGVLIALAYPVYCAVLKRERGRVAPEILSLTDELMK